MDYIHEIINQIFSWVQGLGYFGIVLGLMLEVIPSEIVLAYGGYLVSIGDISFTGAVIFGTIGAIAQNWILYAIGRYAGRPFFEKYGKYLKVSKKNLDTAEGWFNKYGAGIVFTGRFIPVMRQIVSIPAGMARMNFWLFTLLTALASIPWSLLFVFLGWKLGDQWQSVSEKAGPYVQPAILIAIALLIVYIVIKIWRSRTRVKQS
ncbi:hypothetical protein BVG16_24690 [Paenibacillus selenitireducens]|jgi:membrane protein DedA with SNARE-associated domain|uniref:VTT domain-containing protein n=1 Tax=Paenibacillus selenitireducens TaxID=1324314 RepID=A0A1T2X436_9BACL|nr:DedA family protein [Paenibacillus selenitireducens]OPA74323.1 hypothetical protein BVG16_24690 [Paenibacillus selenitireducens]